MNMYLSDCDKEKSFSLWPIDSIYSAPLIETNVEIIVPLKNYLLWSRETLYKYCGTEQNDSGYFAFYFNDNLLL